MIVDARVEIYFGTLQAYFQPIVLCFEESDDIESLEEALCSPEAIQQARNAFSDSLGIPENLLPEVSFRHGQCYQEEKDKIAPLIDSWLWRTSAGVLLKLRQFSYYPTPYRAVFKVDYWEEIDSGVRHSGKFVVQFDSFAHFWVVMSNTPEIVHSAIHAKFDLSVKQHTTPICIGITDDEPYDMEIPSPGNHRPDN